MAKKPQKRASIDGPIPGENFTSNTKNYPWHRPPTETDFNKIVKKSVDKVFNDPERSSFILTALEEGETIADIVTGSIRVAVGQGKMSVDQGVLAAGPVAKAIETLAKKAKVKPNRGWQQEPRVLTPERVRAFQGPRGDKPAETQPAPAKPEKPSGFMDGPASSKTQDKMLGRSADEETTE